MSNTNSYILMHLLCEGRHWTDLDIKIWILWYHVWIRISTIRLFVYKYTFILDKYNDQFDAKNIFQILAHLSQFFDSTCINSTDILIQIQCSS